MPFDEAEKERIRYHMGYTNASPAASIQFGLSRPIQTLFLVDSAMELLRPDAENRVRAFIETLDKIECRLREGVDYLVVTKVDTTEIRPDYLDKLEDEYCRWAARLADEVGAPLYPGAARFANLFRVNAGSIPVRNG